MNRYVAFLRGINVGGRRIKMDRLRRLIEELDYEDVATFIASGNVIFSASSADVEELEDEIERHLARRLGYEVPTFIRSPAELEAIAAFDPPGTDESEPSDRSVYVIFLPAPADDDLRSKFDSLRSETDDFRFSGREIYWLIRGKLSESPAFGAPIQEATADVPTTRRKITTVRRLVAKLDSSLARGSAEHHA